MRKISAPFFEFGPKTYLWGSQALALAVTADKLSERYGVDIIFTAQYTDIERIRRHTQHIHVFAQHIDYAPPGIGMGGALAEAIIESGASGVMLNHEERPLSLAALHKTVERAKAVGMNTIICAGDAVEGMAAACMQPDIVLVEDPELIGGGRRSEEDLLRIPEINRRLKEIAPGAMVMHAAGIRNAEDVYHVIHAGADGTGSTSGIIKAADPHAMMEEMIAAVRKAWDKKSWR